jgi:hypothetical protein
VDSAAPAAEEKKEEEEEEDDDMASVDAHVETLLLTLRLGFRSLRLSYAYQYLTYFMDRVMLCILLLHDCIFVDRSVYLSNKVVNPWYHPSVSPAM